MSETIEYLPLPDTYKDHSMTFRLVKRVGDVAMFAAGAEGFEPLEWEVMVIQRRKAGKLPDGTMSVAREKVPSPEQWGTCGWTYTTKEPAENRFAMLVEREQERAKDRLRKAPVTPEPPPTTI